MNNLSSSQAAFERSIQVMRERFQVRAEQQVQEIDCLMERIEADSNDEDAWAALLGIVHKISGVADTFGFVKLGDLARAAEELLTFANSETKSNTTDRMLGAVEDVVDELDRIVLPSQNLTAIGEQSASFEQT